MTQNSEIVRALYVARGRRPLSDYRALQAVLDEVQQSITRQDAPLLTWTRVSNQKAALQAARAQAPGIAVVELVETAKRLDFCTQFASRWPSTHLIAVTSAPLPDISLHFEKIIPHPVSVHALRTAIAEMLCTGGNDYLIQAGDVSLDLHHRVVITPRGEHHITPKQCALLQILMERRNEVVSRREIMQEIWQTNFLEDTRTLDVHMRWLRERIEQDPSNPHYIVTVRGRGYRFVA